MQRVNTKTGEILSDTSDEYSTEVGQKGLYGMLPIPAFEVLSAMGEYSAQKVLVALVSYQGKVVNGQNIMWPSYPSIMRQVGIGRSSVANGIKVLEQYGFIKIRKRKTGKNFRNIYQLLDSAYDVNQMGEMAKQHFKPTARCLRCLKYLKNGEYGVIDGNSAHWGCGSPVVLRKNKKRANK